MPSTTDADRILSAEMVALARVDDADRFSYRPVEFLKGVDDGESVDLFVDSQSRRLLAANADHRAILVRDREQQWRSLGIGNPTYLQLVRRMVILAPHWQGTKGQHARQEFFRQLFGHPDRAIYDLAYLEFAKAPYAEILALGRLIPRDALTRILDDRMYYEWRPLAILMLSQNGTSQDHQYIMDSLDSASRFGISQNLSAIVAAAIELEGESVVELVESNYFSNPNRQREELVEVTRALTLHANEGRTELRDRIVAALQVLSDHHPKLAKEIAVLEDIQAAP